MLSLDTKTSETTNTVGFAAADDDHPSDTSPAGGAGQVIDGLDFDRDGMVRSSPPAIGVLEHPDDADGEIVEVIRMEQRGTVA